MVTDERGNTPLHLALSRLRILDLSSKSTPFLKKRDIENVSCSHCTNSTAVSFKIQIVDMLREYLSRHADGLEDDDDDEDQTMKQSIRKKTDIGELEKLAGQLSLSDTTEQVCIYIYIYESGTTHL